MRGEEDEQARAGRLAPEDEVLAGWEPESSKPSLKSNKFQMDLFSP